MGDVNLLFFLNDALAPVGVEADVQDDVEQEGDDEAGEDEGVIDFLEGGVYAGEAAEDMGDDCKSRELTRTFTPVILLNLGNFAEYAQGSVAICNNASLAIRTCWSTNTVAIVAMVVPRTLLLLY